MADRIELRRVTGDGTPGELVAAATLDAGIVTYYGRTAQETFEMLARRFRRSEAEIFVLVRANGWSNGWLMAVHTEA